MKFSHPLAKKAKVWSSRAFDGAEQPVLVIITTLVLESGSERYKPKLVERLSEAARTYLAESKVAENFMLMNRAKDWNGST